MKGIIVPIISYVRRKGNKLANKLTNERFNFKAEILDWNWIQEIPYSLQSTCKEISREYYAPINGVKGGVCAVSLIWEKRS